MRVGGGLYLGVPLLESYSSGNFPLAPSAALTTSPSPSPAEETGWAPLSSQDHLWVPMSPLLSPELEVEEHLQGGDRDY